LLTALGIGRELIGGGRIGPWRTLKVGTRLGVIDTLVGAGLTALSRTTIGPATRLFTLTNTANTCSRCGTFTGDRFHTCVLAACLTIFVDETFGEVTACTLSVAKVTTYFSIGTGGIISTTGRVFIACTE
tara:strand:+ start:1437 stop:1826 length:390 start_codon:yes stop_codon:yes gene_type:complete